MKQRRRLFPVIIALGSNLGDRRLNLRRALHELGRMTSIVRVSSIYETEPLDAPSAVPPFLNMVVAVLTSTPPVCFMEQLLEVEQLLGRNRRGRKNDSRTIDLDLILYGALTIRSTSLTLPHPRFGTRNFVLEPLKELRLPWADPSTGRWIDKLTGEGTVERVGSIYPAHLQSRL